MLYSSDDLQKDAEKENANAKRGERLIVTKDIKTVLQIPKSAAKGHKTISGENKISGAGCSSRGRAGHLLIRSLMVQSLATAVCMPSTVGQDTNPKLHSDASIGV